MANRIYISVIGTDINFSSICTEDIAVQAQSQFSKLGDFCPAIASLASMVTAGQNIAWEGISEGMASVTNALDVPIWQRTEPVKVTTDLNFFIRTSGYYDVWKPTMTLQSMSILSKSPKGDGKLITPGLSIDNIQKISASGGKGAQIEGNDLKSALIKSQSADINEIAGATDLPSADTFSTQFKLCSVYIPAIVYLPMAIVEVSQPTWSKQLSDQGYPIWSKVNVQFTGLYPAVYETNFGAVCPEKIGKILI